VSFYGFVSLFPLLLLAAAIAGLALGSDGEEVVQELVDDNIPELKLDVSPFFASAGTLSVVGAGILISTGLSWVDATRAAVRSMWRLDDQPGNFAVRKAYDLVALLGLGLLLLASWGASVGLSQLADHLLGFAGIDGSWHSAALQVVSIVLAVAVSAVMFAYLLSGLPRVRIPTAQLVWVTLLGGAVFEVLRQVLVGFVVRSADREAYVTLGIALPLAILAWIYVVTRLLMFMAALSAESASGVDETDDVNADRSSSAHPAEDGA
jgi:membrane protein